MPQELQVLRCYSCEAFQGHIVKKSSKWECKICGEKQSIKKVYGRGSGKDCRLYVQELNQKRVENNEEALAAELKIECSDLEKNICTSVQYNNDIKPNRWAEFLPSTTTLSSDVEEERDYISNYTFERPIKKRKCTQLNKNYSKPTQELLINEAIHTVSSSHTSAIYNKWSNCLPPDVVKENTEIFNDVLPKPFKNQKRSELNQRQKKVDQESYIKEKSNGFPFASSTTSENDKSSGWAEFVSNTSTSLDHTENHELLNNILERPAINHESCEDLISNAVYGNTHQILDTGTNQIYHTQKYKPDVLRFQPSSSKLHEFTEAEDQFEPNKLLTNSSSNYHKSSLSDSNLKLEKVLHLFNDEENHLDSIFTF